MLNNFTQLILLLSQGFVKLVYLNVLWLLFTLIGGIIFGITPATYALFSTSKLIYEGKIGANILSVFWRCYKEVFVWSQLVGVFLFLAIIILSVDIYLFWSLDFTGSFLITSLFIGLLIVFLVSISFLFPIMAYFKAKPMEYFKISFFIGFRHLKYSILSLVGSVLIVILSYLLPALLFVLLMSSIAMWLTWVSSFVLPNYIMEEK